jgi:hypothetical protein
MFLYKLLSLLTTTDNELESMVLSYFGHCNNAICSSEYFQLLNARDWRKLYKLSVKLGLNLKIIFYFRDVLPFFLSSYDQSIKGEGQCRLFDEWVEMQEWQQAAGLRIMADELPHSSIMVLHFEAEKKNLFRGFLDALGIDPSFEVDEQNKNGEKTNRSLTEKERNVLLLVNKSLGSQYSMELFDLFFHATPLAEAETPSYHKNTEAFLLSRFSSEVDWLNNTFFNGQSVASVLPMKSEQNQFQNLLTNPTSNNSEEKQALIWALEKLKTIKDETEQRLLTLLNDAAQNRLGNSRPDIPADFDVLAYLLLNSDLLHAGFDPIEHFIIHGKQEGRVYKF